MTRNEFVIACMPLAKKIASFYREALAPRDDLEQAALLAACKAYESYDGTRGTAPPSWAFGPMKLAVRKEISALGAHGAANAGRIRRGTAGIRNRVYFLSSVEDGEPQNPIYHAPAREDNSQDTLDDIDCLLSAVSKRQAAILRDVYLNGNSYAKTGEMHGISRQRVHNIIGDVRKIANAKMA